MIRSRTGGLIVDEHIEGFCHECRRNITQDGLGPEVGHDPECMWTMHDGDELNEEDDHG